MRALLALALCLATASCERDGGPPRPRDGGGGEPTRAATERDLGESLGAAPRERVAGFAGMVTTSTVHYASRPDLPHRLQAVFQFPDRARTTFSLRDVPESGVAIEYRLGPVVHAKSSAEIEARRLDGADARGLVLRFELRRALFLYPDGFEWSGDGAHLTAPLGPGVSEVGSLVAELDSEGRPISMAALGPDGREVERLEVSDWRTTGTRRMPARLEYTYGEQVVWIEDVEDARMAVYVPDAFFVPPVAEGGGDAEGRLVQVEHPSRWARRAASDATPEGLDAWPARLEAWIERWETELDVAEVVGATDHRVTLELDATGRPVAALVRLLDDPEDEAAARAAGFEPGASGRALVLTLARARDLTPQDLEALAALVPAGQRAGAPYLVLEVPRADGRASLVLPYAP